MKRILLTAAGALLTVGGLIVFFLGIRGFLAAVPVGTMLSPKDVGLYAPPTLWIGTAAAALGLILLTFRRHF